MGLDKRARIPRKLPFLERWLLPLVVLGISVGLLFGGDAIREALRYERAAIVTGEIWRLLSGHFVHLGSSHLILNLAGLGLVWYLVGDAMSRIQWVAVMALGIIVIDLGFWFLNPDLQWYVGLSGVLHTLLVAGLIVSASPERKDAIVVAIIVAAKVGWEQFGGPLPGSVESSGGAVIVDAHLYGAAAGVLAGILARIRVARAGSI